jgi:hypothetical protein
MAHFAKIEAGIVTQVVVVDNEYEADGQAYLNSLGLEGTWVQTSYNGNIRGKYAGIGDTYDAELDEFIAPYVQPELPVQEVVQLPVPAPTEPTTPVE